MKVLTLSLVAVLSAVGVPPSSDQKPAGNPSRINACTILTRDLIVKVTNVADKSKLDIPPKEEPAPRGSHCEYAGIGLLIDSLPTADLMRKSPPKDWVAVSGVGDTAYFHHVKNFIAELMVWSGTHHFGILMDVPVGGTAEQLKPSMIQLANLIIPKLK